MISTEEQLRVALIEFMRAATERGDVAGALQRISELQSQLGADVPPTLRHYLERRSYPKALELLNSGRPAADKPQRRS